MNTQKSPSKSLGRLSPVGLLIWIATFFLVGCTGKEPIRVGFVAQLTGVQAELGVQERNGVQLAMEEINAAGGVAGRSIELIMQDDQGTSQGAQAADQKLIDAGVVAIIGHATSAQTMAGLTVTNPAHVAMLSPTASTPELSGRDDCFFRIVQSMEARIFMFARHVYQDRDLTRTAAIWDTDNTAYSKSFLDGFADIYQSLGGQMVAEAGFSSKVQPDFAPLVAQLRASNPDGLLIIAADIDTAMIAQQARLMDWLVPLFTTSWAQTETLIKNGGQAVEGLEIEVANILSDQTPAYLDFKTRYEARFGETPTFGASLGYEAAQVLAAALDKTGGKAEGLAQALVGIKNFKGLTDTFSFDRYGDVDRSYDLYVIRDGKYVAIKALELTEP